ncbi:bifunctional folylpolyglutamate synthase/dihydrofolate synthase [Gephyromycinifex aptenodytis]|uniref:bifunctional folylpolyglutamate synthase/dihydrofolate synthase n=1 Tax=Gephyromycinifex aptenodytis TaxID=2716227 RepID=UPI0014450293|nr:folylpolyglutamate synthase/dihydrofolate synthase family protein [Gephyromycinifex aptenodytis]
MSGTPDAQRRAAEEALELRRRAREVEEAILARAPEHDIDPTLERVRQVLDLLGEPHRAAPVIHIAGTNGKTSTARMTETLLLGLGLSTGRFTSPHLHSITERIVLSGEPISMQRFVAAYDDVIPYIEMVDARNVATELGPLSFFEVLVVMAFACFADAPVDVVVLEVGLGGTWDATNVADGAVNVITPIGIDHERFLGSDLASIAGEKAGILTQDGIAVIAGQEPDAAEVITARIEELGCTAAYEGRDIEVVSRDLAVGGQLLNLQGLARIYPELLLPLHGEHQAHNALLALAAVEAFLGGGQEALDTDLVREAFGVMSSPGRLEIVRRSPTVLVDSAHNPAGARSLAAALRDSFTFGRIVGVMAVMADKDVDGILEELEPVFDELVVTRNTSPRCMSAQRLGELAGEVFGEDRVHVVRDLPDAIDTAAGLADSGDSGGVAGGVVVTGSVITAGEARMLVGVTEV